MTPSSGVPLDAPFISRGKVTSPNIFFDTNAFYACEDVRVGHQHANAKIATALKDLAQSNGCELFLHAATERDIRARPVKN